MEDIRIEPAAGLLVLQFRHRSPNKKPKWFDATQESDGTLRVAGIITALLQDPPIPVVGVEEPELTVHPGAIPLLFDYLKEASTRSQLIVTTHSPELLDLVSVDDIRVVERRDGATTVARMAPHQWDAVRSGLLSLGEVLRAEGIQQDLRSGPREGSYRCRRTRRRRSRRQPCFTAVERSWAGTRAGIGPSAGRISTRTKGSKALPSTQDGSPTLRRC